MTSVSTATNATVDRSRRAGYARPRATRTGLAGIVAAAASALLLSGCTGAFAPDVTPTETIATAPTASATDSRPLPEPTAGPNLALRCTLPGGETRRATVHRDPSPDFTEPWSLGGGVHCQAPALKVVPSNDVERVALSVSGYERDNIATLYELCTSLEARSTYLDPTYVLSPAQVAEVKGMLTLCPTHPFAGLYTASLDRAKGLGSPPAQGGDAGAPIDLTTDEGICAADAELTNLELNDALAPLLGFPADRGSRTPGQDEAIRAYKTAAFERACPARAGN